MLMGKNVDIACLGGATSLLQSKTTSEVHHAGRAQARDKGQVAMFVGRVWGGVHLEAENQRSRMGITAGRGRVMV